MLTRHDIDTGIRNRTAKDGESIALQIIVGGLFEDAKIAIVNDVLRGNRISQQTSGIG
jgi:hypothetical protein